VIALLAGPAYSQSLDLSRIGEKKHSAAEDARNAAIDKAYRSATDKIPDRKVDADPWHDVRGASASRNNQAKP